MIRRLLVRAALGSVAVLAFVPALTAQNVMRVRFDTVTAKAGDTVIVNARYTFMSTRPHNITGYSAQIDFDSTEVHLLGYVLAGTATPPDDTNLAGTSHRGISTIGTSEIDLSNPVLFGIRFRVDRALADTAFVSFDRSIDMFDPSTGVDSTVREDGWVRTESASGHVAVFVPDRTIKGETVGFSPDSVLVDLPVVVSNIAGAGMTGARFTFTYDSTRLVLVGASAAEEATVEGLTKKVLGGGLMQATVTLASKSGVLAGGDTLLRLSFVGLVGLDTICEGLTNLSLRGTNNTALIGNTVFREGSICLEGSAPSDVRQKQPLPDIGMYPNPATATVRFEGMSFDGTTNFEVFDAAGRRIESGVLIASEWKIPPNVGQGAYRIVIRNSDLRWMGSLLVAPRP